ncbi:MAG: TIGR03560 family F420-dependent LLM class oxidoreductase [Candidatus Bathyarchaeia archaeon]
MSEKVSFGVFLPFHAFQNYRGKTMFNSIRDVTLECESLGYHSIWLDDHLMYKNSQILECWTTLAALSTVTSRIRLGTMVTCVSFRKPALLAKMAATLDVISGGRLEFGIGSGIQEEEHLAYGFPFPPASTRIAHLNEALDVIKKLWTEDKADYAGNHEHINGAICEPKPLQKPHPPITIGGGGEKLTMKVAARHADRFDWGYVPSLDRYKHKLEILKRQCAEIGRDFQEIEKSCWPGGQVVIAQDRGELEAKIAREKPRSISREEFEKTSLIGTPHECVSKLQPYIDLGVTHFMLFFGDLPSLNSLRLFAETIVKKYI